MTHTDNHIEDILGSQEVFEQMQGYLKVRSDPSKRRTACKG